MTKTFWNGSAFQLWLTSLGLLLLAYLGLIGFIAPYGEFPFNDDWAYSIPLDLWMDGNGFRIPDFVSPALVGQLLWSLPWMVVNGEFSYSVAAGSVTGLCMLSLSFLPVFFRRLGFSMVHTFFIMCVLALGPVFLVLSFTYMTDVPFCMLTLIALLVYTRVSMSRSIGSWLVFVGCSAWATSIRQPGIILFLLPLLDGIVGANEGRWRLGILTGILGIVIFVGIDASLSWLGFSDGMEIRTLDDTTRGSLASKAMRAAKNLAGHAGYLGFFLIPVTMGHLSTVSRPRWRVLSVMAIGLTVLLWFLGDSFPYKPNILRNGGIGPETLRDVYLLGLPSSPRWPKWIGLILHSIAMLSLGVLIDRMIHLWKNHPSGWIRPWMMFGVLYWTACSVVSVFDRYMLPLVGLFAILLFVGRSHSPGRNQWILLGVMALFGLLATRECFAWHRSLEKAVTYINNSGIPIDQVDLGYEWMGRLNYDRVMNNDLSTVDWWVQDPRVVVAFGPIPGYRKRATFPFYRSLWFRTDQLWVLERDQVIQVH